VAAKIAASALTIVRKKGFLLFENYWPARRCESIVSGDLFKGQNLTAVLFRLH
jgi:hypothetical protein